MNTRFKLAAALGLALATGFAGVASAQTADPATSAPVISQTGTPAAMPAQTTTTKTAVVKAPMKKASIKKASIKKASMKRHRTLISHRMMKHRKVVQGLSTRAKVAHKLGTTSHVKIVKSGLLRRHVAKAKILYTKHAMNRAAKPSVIR